MKIIIIGGGAAGFFASIIAKENAPDAEVILLEKTAALLSKVKVSGGGRCNVTHACFDPKVLVQNYPRGGQELLGPLHRFQPRDTIQWFEDHGVELKVEDDGRMFPTTDDSATIINCLLKAAKQTGVEIRTLQKISHIAKKDSSFVIEMGNGEKLVADRLLLATGSSPQGQAFAQNLGHTIQPPVPSLFTFNIPQFSLSEQAGITVEKVVASLPGASLQQSGPLLITHWGFSGPAALKLSAWGARYLFACSYQTTLAIDWLPNVSPENMLEALKKLRQDHPNASLHTRNLFGLAKNLWKRLIEQEVPQEGRRLATYSNPDLQKIAGLIKNNSYNVNGKTTHKEEFVTCGGVTLKEVDFRTMQSRLCPGLFFSGEILDIDAVTGGFNFQNAWTTGWIAGKSISQ